MTPCFRRMSFLIVSTFGQAQCLEEIYHSVSAFGSSTGTFMLIKFSSFPGVSRLSKLLNKAISY
jgi:hypothetical protein